jgi:hypothetical protein
MPGIAQRNRALLHLPDGYKPEQIRDALAEKIKTLPDLVRRSLTWDTARRCATGNTSLWLSARCAGSVKTSAGGHTRQD